MDNVKDAADKAAGMVDKGVSEAVQLATHTAQDLLARGSEIWDTAKVCDVPKAAAVNNMLSFGVFAVMQQAKGLEMQQRADGKQ